MAGLFALNGAGRDMLAGIIGDGRAEALGPASVLELATKLTDDAILFYANPQRVWHEGAVVQGIWNLRDTLKSVGAMLVMVTPPGVILPPEVVQDVLVIDETGMVGSPQMERVLSAAEQARARAAWPRRGRRTCEPLPGALECCAPALFKLGR